MNEANDHAGAIEERAAQWLARQDGDAWHAGLQRELDDWLAADLRHRVAWLRLRAAWQRADALAGQAGQLAAPVPASAREPAQTAAEAPAQAARRPLARFSSWRMAAGLALACGLAALLAPDLGGWQQGERHATRIGENRTIALADGSRLTLNTATRLRTASGAERRVWLDSGEAYFDIVHDPARPFVVDAGNSRVTVLGTRFTVRRDGASTRVLVEQGRVRVSEQGGRGGAGEAVELVRNQEATSTGGHIALGERSQAQLEQRLAWREGRIVFDQTTLGEAADEFNRYNKRKLVVSDPEVAALRIGGSFAPSNVDGFVRLLEQGFGLQAARSGDRIVLSH